MLCTTAINTSNMIRTLKETLSFLSRNAFPSRRGVPFRTPLGSFQRFPDFPQIGRGSHFAAKKKHGKRRVRSTEHRGGKGLITLGKDDKSAPVNWFVVVSA